MGYASNRFLVCWSLQKHMPLPHLQTTPCETQNHMLLENKAAEAATDTLGQLNKNRPRRKRHLSTITWIKGQLY